MNRRSNGDLNEDVPNEPPANSPLLRASSPSDDLSDEGPASPQVRVDAKDGGGSVCDWIRRCRILAVHSEIVQ